jgi:hypothetical protein
MFDVPVVIFFFKRTDKLIKILERVSKVKPSKIYLISDGPRNDDEKETILLARELVEKSISWECDVVKNYALFNQGVYDRIGNGAKWVFSLEDKAIFLEDDNLPEISFFYFCQELLNRYFSDSRILWICGSNYFGVVESSQHSSYLFTRNMFPCGWASWSSKFLAYYDGEMNNWNNPILKEQLKRSFYHKALYRQEFRNWTREFFNIKHKGKAKSWDYQMSFSIRANDLLGIVPIYNQIRNIGVDIHSIHGGIDFSNVMTRRFCEIPTKELVFPLKHPEFVILDSSFEDEMEKYLTYPFGLRIKGFVARFLRKIFSLKPDESLQDLKILSFVKRFF